jgi:hypothetical protein
MVPDANSAGGKGTQSSTHALDLFWREITSAQANQNSVLVIHAFLLSVHLFFQKLSCGTTPESDPRIPLALAKLRVSIPGAHGRSEGAFSLGAQACGNTLDFLLRQLTSAVAAKYAIVLVHTFTLFFAVQDFLKTMNSAE